MEINYDKLYLIFGGLGRWQHYAFDKKKEAEDAWLYFWRLIRLSILEPLKRAYFNNCVRPNIMKYQETIIRIEDEAQMRIKHIRDKTENNKKWYIEQITNLLKIDPDYKEKDN